MKTRIGIAVLLIAVAALAACDREARMSQLGFRLPDGDADAGRAAFLYMQCHQCHTIANEEFPEIPGHAAQYVALGGTVSRVKTYGELVTAIINPSHRLAPGYAKEVISDDGESKMPIYNTHMTVQELIDIVMYLQPKYDVQVPVYRYRIYPTT
ncbi:MAG TPA: cytochrome C [Woeseiaceae bacterium]|jgi:mono/diheme cytochrome c family protein|nr:cytochrome C [Woeseiaceae bacterium]